MEMVLQNQLDLWMTLTCRSKKHRENLTYCKDLTSAFASTTAKRGNPQKLYVTLFKIKEMYHILPQKVLRTVWIIAELNQ